MAPSGDSALARGLSDTALLVLGSALGAVMGLVTLRLLLSGLSEADYGRYSLFLVVAGVLAVACLWPSHAVLRLGAEEFEERGRVGRTFGSVLALIAFSAAVFGSLAAVWGPTLDAFVDTACWPLAVAFGALSGVSLLSYACLQPVGKVGLRTLFPALTKGFYAGLLALVLASQGTLSLDQVLVLCTATLIPAVVLPLVAVGARLRPVSVDAATTRRALDYGWPLLLRNLGIAGIAYVDLLVIRHYLGPIDAGRYDVAYRIAEQVIVLGIALEFVAGPVLASAAARRDPETLRRFYRLVAPQMAWLWSLGAALLVVIAEPALTLLGAKSVDASAAVLKLLALVIALRGPQLLEGAVLEAHLLSRWPTLFFFAGFAVNLVADVAFLETTDWGLVGPAVATVLGFAVQGILRATYIRGRFGVDALRPYLGVLPAAALVAVDVFVEGSLPLLIGAWLATAVAVILGGRSLGLFPAETQPYLAHVRMPAPLRRALDRLYA